MHRCLGDTSACCVVTESDPELEVEYRESREPDLGPAGLDSASLSDADTVNPDEDSFSILGGDSPTGPESLVRDLPPLFLHLTCSVRLRGQHSSVPVCSLPTCLGESRVPGGGPQVPVQPACLLEGWGQSLRKELISTEDLKSVLIPGLQQPLTFPLLQVRCFPVWRVPPLEAECP